LIEERSVPSGYEEAIYNMLSSKSVTTNESSERLGINYRATKDMLKTFKFGL